MHRVKRAFWAEQIERGSGRVGPRRATNGCVSIEEVPPRPSRLADANARSSTTGAHVSRASSMVRKMCARVAPGQASREGSCFRGSAAEDRSRASPPRAEGSGGSRSAAPRTHYAVLKVAAVRGRTWAGSPASARAMSPSIDPSRSSAFSRCVVDSATCRMGSEVELVAMQCHTHAHARRQCLLQGRAPEAPPRTRGAGPGRRPRAPLRETSRTPATPSLS